MFSRDVGRRSRNGSERLRSINNSNLVWTIVEVSVEHSSISFNVLLKSLDFFQLVQNLGLCLIIKAIRSKMVNARSLTERFRQSHANIQGSKLDNYVQPKTTLSPRKTVRLRSFAQSIYDWIISTFGEVWRADCKSGRQKSCSDYRKCFMNLGKDLQSTNSSSRSSDVFWRIQVKIFRRKDHRDTLAQGFE